MTTPLAMNSGVWVRKDSASALRFTTTVCACGSAVVVSFSISPLACATFSIGFFSGKIFCSS